MIIKVPGDKSLTQRALILASLAEGQSRLSGLLYGGDAASTAAALRALGAGIGELPADGSEVVVDGVGLRGLKAPSAELDLGNSGTGSRLLLGVLAGSGVTATVTGDDSLRSRPMGRVTEPLSLMGARFEYGGEQRRLPITVHGARPLKSIEWRSPVASAQVKSSILFAGLVGAAEATVVEPMRSRDHSERMLRGIGATVEEGPEDGGWRVGLVRPPDRIEPFEFAVPGDISSAAFPLGWAALGGAGEPLTVEDVGLNPTRTAVLDVLRRMGADVAVTPSPNAGPEPVGAVTVAPGALRGVVVSGDEVPRLIDELPLIAALGAHAEGVTSIRDAEELRAKESDRISAMAENLSGLGVDVEERPDGLDVHGTGRPLRGRVECRDDHRIAMAFGVLGAVGSNEIEIDDPAIAGVSFPGFWELLGRLAATPPTT
jgi:3-phosphoshikimate 1-carboxyvinyltransferase